MIKSGALKYSLSLKFNKGLLFVITNKILTGYAHDFHCYCNQSSSTVIIAAIIIKLTNQTVYG